MFTYEMLKMQCLKVAGNFKCPLRRGITSTYERCLLVGASAVLGGTFFNNARDNKTVLKENKSFVYKFSFIPET